MNRFFLIITLSLSLLYVVDGYSQDNIDSRYNNPSNKLTEEERLRQQQLENEKTDTLGKKKDRPPRKPLRSYLFDDSLKSNRIFAWTYNPYTNGIVRAKVDTMLSGFNRDYLFQPVGSVGSAYLGNLGAPSTPIVYYERINQNKLSFLDAYKEYLYFPDNIIFYNSKVAFSQFSYINSGQRDRAEEQFRLSHAQNISPSTGFNITYRNNRTRGMYDNQQSINKNFSFAFSHTGPKYTTHFGYVFNSGEMRENGGVKNRGEILDTLIDLPQNIIMNLKDAKTHFKGNGFYWTQSLAITLSSLKGNDSLLTNETESNRAMTSLDSIRMLRRKQNSGGELADRTMLFFGTSVEYDSYKKFYTDTRNGSGTYYQNWYIDPVKTNDSIRETNLDLKFFAQFQPYNRDGAVSLIGGGIGLLNNGYYHFKPGDYISGSSAKEKKSNFYIYGDANGRWRKYVEWDAHIKYFPMGYRSQDLNIGGNLALSAYVKDRPITLKLGAEFETKSASYWQTSYYSNHYKWNNNFDKEVRTSISAKLSIKQLRMEIGFNQILSTGAIYFSPESLPVQYSGALSVTAISLQKNFVVGGFNFEHNAVVQASSNQNVAPVPLLAADISYYFRFVVVKNALDMEVGFNGNYTTKYYGYGYSPAISQFYNQREAEVGNYPWLDVFATGKWKRLRFIVKIQNANHELFGGRNYFSVGNYPLNRRMLKYGLSWSFYN